MIGRSFSKVFRHWMIVNCSHITVSVVKLSVFHLGCRLIENLRYAQEFVIRDSK